MARVVIVGPSQPSRTPRLVRNADALSGEGHEVIVVTPQFEARALPSDEAIVARSTWKYIPVPLLGRDGTMRLRYSGYKRAMRQISGATSKLSFFPSALIYGSNKLARTLRALDAEFYLAQQQSVIPLVARQAAMRNQPFACDIEDILSESDDRDAKLVALLESAYLRRAAAVLTMSEVAAEYLKGTYRLGSCPIALHNCPSLAERSKKTTNPISDRPSIYWFGQTLGAHSLAIELIRANAEIGCPFKIYLRGRPDLNYVEKIEAVVDDLHVESSIEILPTVEPMGMVSEAQRFDILFASQPTQLLFHQLAIGNKLFTGLLAGCAILGSDTVAHRRLRETIPDAMLLVDQRKDGALRNALKRLADSPPLILSMKRASWIAGTERFNWEFESRALCASIGRCI